MDLMHRRTFLTTVCASGLLSACGGGNSNAGSSGDVGSYGSVGATPPTNIRVPLTIDLTKAALPADAGTVAYAYIIGGLYTDANLTNFVCYRLDAPGTVHAIVPPQADASGNPVPQTGDNTVKAGYFPDPNNVVNANDTKTIINGNNYPTDWADYSIALSVTQPNVIELGNINTNTIAGLGKGNNAFSMRIYISLGIPKLPFTAQLPSSGGAVTYQNPYAGPGFDSGAPGSLCLFDWFECSIDSSGVLDGNSTYVDQFGLPLIVDAQPGGSPQGQLTISRTKALANIAAFDQTVYAGLAQQVAAPSAYPIGTAYLRAISPDHLSGLTLSDPLPGNPTHTKPAGTTAFQTYFDTAIASWDGQQISITDTASGTYVGTPSGGAWTFTYQSGGAAGAGSPATLDFGQITTANIWQCKGTLAQGSAAQQNIGKQILAAFNRGVMSTTLNDGNCPAASTFYPSGGAFNLWSKSFHGWSANGQAYGFGYDDVCGANPSFNTTGALQSLTITLGLIPDLVPL